MSEKTEKTEKTEAVEAEVEVETVEVPQDLSTLKGEELSTIQTKLTARGRQLAARIAEGAELSADEVEEANLLNELADEIDTELASREEKKAELAGSLERFADKPFKGAAKPFESEDDEEDEEDEEEMAAAPAEEAEAELAAEDTEETDETVAEEAEATEATEGEMSTQTRRSFKGADMSELAAKSPASKPKNVPVDIEAPKYEFTMESTRQAPDGAGMQFASPSEVAAAMWKKRMSFGNIPQGTRDEMSIATGTKVWDEEIPSVGLDPVENLKAFNQLTARDGLVASGAQCTPQTQLYDFFRLAEPIQDVENALPTVQAPRGGIRYIQANCDDTGAGAVGLWGTESPPATDGAIDPTSGEKPCDTVTCPTVAEVLVEAVTQCTVFDNLQYRTFPELIENFLEDVAVQFTLKKQTYYLDKIDTASTQTVGVGAYGAARSMIFDLTVAANAYRKRHHMPRGARLSVMIPDWAVDVVKADLLNDGDMRQNVLIQPGDVIIIPEARF